MGIKGVLVCQCIFIAFLLKIGTTIKLYPNWWCHSGWNDSYTGSRHVSELMIQCAKPRFPTPDEELDVRRCKKSCLYYHLRIIDQAGKDSAVELLSEEKMAEQITLRVLTGEGGKVSASLIAHRIRSECSELLKDLAGKPCTEWSDLEMCIEYAWGCRGHESYEDMNATMKAINVEAFWEEAGNMDT